VVETVTKFGSSRLNKMIEDGKIDPDKTEWVDTFNQTTNEETSGTILTRVDASNHYMINEGGMVKCVNQYDENGVQRHLQDRIFDSEGVATAVTTSFHPNIIDYGRAENTETRENGESEATP
jgi:ribosomal protein L24E